MKKILIVSFLLLSKSLFAQKLKNVDTLNIEIVNNSIESNGLLNIVKIYELTHYAPYNEKRYELSKYLTTEVDFLNTFYSTSLFSELKSSIENLKKKFPNINLSTYELAYKSYYEKKEANKIIDAYNDSISKDDMRKAGIASKLSKQAEEDRNYKMRMHDDSIYQVKKDKENAIEAESVRLQNFAYKNECIKKFGKVKGEKISQGQIALGDNKQMVEFAWGSADRISNSISNNASIEIWYYKKYNAYLSFKKDILINYIK
jgi:hypothetical protein